MRYLLACAVLFVAGALIPIAAFGDSPPPGATALCKDGTYSFSQTHSGTCSHHGGVSQWLDGSGSSTTTTPATTVMTTTAATTTVATTTTAATTTAATTTTTAVTTTEPATTTTGSSGSRTTPTKPKKPTKKKSGSTSSGPISLGKTVLLRKRTKTSGCTLAAEPDRRCSPGAYYSGLTKRIVCSASFHTSSVRNVPDSEKHQVEVEYGLAPKGYGRTLEIDHIVSLELGGSNDPANLFPEEATFSNGSPGFHVKDKLENRVHDLVCSGQMMLRAAQRQIASDWEALYQKVYGVKPTG